MLEPGTNLAHYEIKGVLGVGGMGEVYRALDRRLERDVALKLLPSAWLSDETWVRRFRREARVLASLDHPGIVTVHSLDEADGLPFLTMQLAEGRTLSQVLAEVERVPVPELLGIALALCDAVAAAHDSGILHRDLKPSNVMVGSHGRVRVLDFGLAKGPGIGADTLTATEIGSTLGTLAYMAPELLAGEPATPASDVFSLGVILYWMASGNHPFDRSTPAATAGAIATLDPPRLEGVEPELTGLILRCLGKDPEQRPATAGDLATAMRSLPGSGRPESGSTRYAVGAAVAIALIMGLVAAWQWRGGQDEQWLYAEALPEIERLNDADLVFDAFTVLEDAVARMPDHPEVRRFVSQITVPVTITSDPPGARVLVRDYRRPEDSWREIGRTPQESVPLPWSLVAIRIENEGHVPFEGYRNPLFDRQVNVELPALSQSRDGMVWVAGGARTFNGRRIEFAPHWMDRYEVTSHEYKQFVDAGGYGDPRWWSEDGLAYRGRMVDATGRPGPAGWEVGGHPPGDADLPVTGISWYEASAYCRWRGYELPTYFHWRESARLGSPTDILDLSNYGTGLRPRGTGQGLGPWGAYDMAGNAKEWIFNSWASGGKGVLGGAWDEPEYRFINLDRAEPTERASNIGFRCADYQPTPELQATLARPTQIDYRGATPVSEETFEVLMQFHDYDASRSLDPQRELVDSSSSTWIRERVDFNAAYSDERVVLNLYLPRDAVPPYQAVLWIPGADAWFVESSDDPKTEFDFIDLFVRSGRAFAFPVYKGTYERRIAEAFSPSTPDIWQQVWIWHGLDLRRTIDYLETREDIDLDALALAGLSSGAMRAPVYLALEDRLKAGILLSGGFQPSRRDRPAIDAVNFAPRATQPLLMINGRYDFSIDYELHQVPLFDAMGTPDSLKRHAVFGGGHFVPRVQMFREILPFLDEHVGPVRR
ncbi:MAG: protein kinase [Gemmatimonadetes bacterium]|nr:protein kinase [Gemmatimonadota bacterium]